MKENLYRTNSLSENHYGRGPERDRHFYHGWTSTKELQSLRGHILAAYGSTSSFQRPLTTGKEVSSITKKIPRRITILEYYFTNVFEARHVIEYCKDWHKDLPIAVMGHSMGGFSAIGIATWYDEIVTAVAMNGSGWWDESERLFRTGLFLGPMDFCRGYRIRYENSIPIRMPMPLTDAPYWP